MIRGWILDSFTLLTPVLLTASSSCLTLVTSCVNPFHLGSPHTNVCQDKKQKREITLFGRDRDLNQYHSYSPRLSSNKCSSRQICFVKTRWFSVFQMSPQNIDLSRHNDALKKITSHWRYDFQFVSALMNQSLVEIQRQKTEGRKLRMTDTKIQNQAKNN